MVKTKSQKILGANFNDSRSYREKTGSGRVEQNFILCLRTLELSLTLRKKGGQIHPALLE